MENAVTFILYISTFVLGICLGSFATALIYRIPRDISWIKNNVDKGAGAAYSACPSCGNRLRILDLVPVFSWLFLRGKCRHCKKPVSCLYPAVEIITAIAVVGLLAAWGPTWIVLPLMFSVPFLISAIVIDWEHMILPDDINIAVSILSLIFVWLLWRENNGDFSVVKEHAASAILLFSVLFLASFVVSKWKGRSALGMGDLKFLPAAGLFLGLSALPSYIVVSGILGLLTAILKGTGRKSVPFPFGPALIISLYIHVFLTGLGFDYTW